MNISLHLSLYLQEDAWWQDLFPSVQGLSESPLTIYATSSHWKGFLHHIRPGSLFCVSFHCLTGQAWSAGSQFIALALTLEVSPLPHMPGKFPLGWVSFTNKGGPYMLQLIQEGDVQANKQIKQILSVAKPHFNCTSLKKCMGPKHWHCLHTTAPL